MIPPSELSRAIRWRKALGLSAAQLGAHIGLGRLAIHYYEKGRMPPISGKPQVLQAKTWHRYKLLCAGFDAQVRSRKPFNW